MSKINFRFSIVALLIGFLLSYNVYADELFKKSLRLLKKPADGCTCIERICTGETCYCTLEQVKAGKRNCPIGLKFASFNNYIHDGSVGDESDFLRVGSSNSEKWSNDLSVSPNDKVSFLIIFSNNASDGQYPAQVGTSANGYKKDGDTFITDYGITLNITQDIWYEGSGAASGSIIRDGVTIHSANGKKIRLRFYNTIGNCYATSNDGKGELLTNYSVGSMNNFFGNGMSVGDRYHLGGKFYGGIIFIIYKAIVEEEDNIETNKVSPINTPPNQEIQTTKSNAQKRLALLIGNANYTSANILKNPVNDVNAMEKTLKTLGFEVVRHDNVDWKQMIKAIDDFGEKLKGNDVSQKTIKRNDDFSEKQKGYDVSLFFYSGHGMQVKGLNYLIPVDANVKSENDVEHNCIKADRILAKMEDAGTKVNIVILDACRDNPFEKSWTRGTSAGKGLAFMNAPTGYLIAYATSPGQTASDGPALNNGLYTSVLLQYMQTPNITILEMFQKVRQEIKNKMNGQQIPWESTSLTDNFYFKPDK